VCGVGGEVFGKYLVSSSLIIVERDGSVPRGLIYVVDVDRFMELDILAVLSVAEVALHVRIAQASEFIQGWNIPVK
jgi:hypothetical protein